MKQVTLKGTNRELGKKSDIKNLRKSGRVPCVFYGNKIDNVLFSVDAKELQTITHTPNSYIVELDIDGKKQLAVYHAAQFNPVTDETMHVDFLAVSQDRPVVIDVPVIITGNSEGVKMGGKLVVNARKLRVSGLIKDLPDTLSVDISDLLIGKQINAGDLSYDNIHIVTPKTAIICSVRSTRNVVAAESEEAAK